MGIRRLLLISLLLSWVVPAGAAVHRCTGADGKPYFSDLPCAAARGGSRDEPVARQPVPAPAVPPASPPPAAVAPRIVEVPPDQVSMVAPAVPASSHWDAVMMIGGILAVLCAPVWLVLIAFRVGGVGTGVAVAVSQVYRDIFVVANFGRFWPPILLLLGGIVMIAAPGAPGGLSSSMKAGYLTRCDTLPAPARNGAVAPFAQSFGVCLSSALEYHELAQHPRPDARIDKQRLLQWKWCRGWDQGEDCEVVYQSNGNIDLAGDGPHIAIGRLGGEPLPPGKYSVQLYVDYMRMARENFEVDLR
jgi:hypothetical protein